MLATLTLAGRVSDQVGASLSLPAILAGVLVTPLGLRPTFEIFGSVIAGLALVVALLAWRTRPVAQPAPSYVRV